MRLFNHTVRYRQFDGTYLILDEYAYWLKTGQLFPYTMIRGRRKLPPSALNASYRRRQINRRKRKAR